MRKLNYLERVKECFIVLWTGRTSLIQFIVHPPVEHHNRSQKAFYPDIKWLNRPKTKEEESRDKHLKEHYLELFRKEAQS